MSLITDMTLSASELDNIKTTHIDTARSLLHNVQCIFINRLIDAKYGKIEKKCTMYIQYSIVYSSISLEISI